MENIDWQDLLFQFSGRINRAKFWIGIGVIWAVMFVGMTIGLIIGGGIGWGLITLAYIGTIWVGLAVSIKRWHDRGKSGWWIFISFIPLVGPIWSLVETGFLEGDKGDNEYGPDPLAAA